MHLRRRSPSCFGLFKSFGPTRSETTLSQECALCQISLQMMHYSPIATSGSYARAHVEWEWGAAVTEL